MKRKRSLKKEITKEGLEFLGLITMLAVFLSIYILLVV